MAKKAAAPEPTGRKQSGAPLFRPGQSGNPAGRPKGSRNKLGEAFIEALHDDFNEHGIAAIQTRSKPRATSPMSSLTLESASSRLHLKSELADLLTERKRRKDRSRLTEYSPYPKQRDFHAMGSVHRERLLMAGNQLGKTYCGAAEAAIHLTGQYPDWWTGRRFNKPVRAWAGSKTGEVTRDGVQRLLIGEPKDESRWGTGAIPGDSITDWSRRQGIPDALDSVLVKHVSGDISTLGFKSYDQGREKWQAETLDFVWCDEEPPLDIYAEAFTRTNAVDGMIYITFTPLLGMSDVVSMFLEAQ